MNAEQWLQERAFSFADFKWIYKKIAKLLLFVGLCSFLATFVYIVHRPVYYEAKAIYRDHKTNEGPKDFKKTFIDYIGKQNSENALVLLKSSAILTKVINALAMQIDANEATWPFEKKYWRIRQALLAERRRQKPIPKGFVFKDACFTGKNREKYFLQFSDEKHFALLNSKKQLIKEGEVAAPLCSSSLSFTLKKTPQKLLVGKFYPLVATPTKEVYRAALKRLYIQEQGGVFIQLSFFDEHRKKGRAFLRKLIQFYEEMIHSKIEKEQQLEVSYLEAKKKEKEQLLQKALSQYAQRSVGKYYSTSHEKALARYERPIRELREEIQSLETSKNHILSSENIEELKVDSFFCTQYNELLSEISLLQKEISNLELETRGNELSTIPNEESTLVELETTRSSCIQQKIEKAQQLEVCKALSKELVKEKPDFSSPLFGNVNSFASSIIERAKKLQYQIDHGLYQTPKEKERYINELAHQKQFLQKHLHSLAKNNERSLEDLINKSRKLAKQITIYKSSHLEHLHSRLEQAKKRAVHFLEQELFDKKNTLEQLEEKAKKLSSLWAMEKNFVHDRSLLQKVIYELTSLIESKKINAHINAYIVDPPSSSYLPEKPRVFLLSFFISLASMILFFFIMLLFYALQGMPVSHQELLYLRFTLLGFFLNRERGKELEQLSKWSKKTLQKALFFLQKNKKAALIGKHCRTIMDALATMIHMQDKKVLVIDFTQKKYQDKGDQKTLSSYLQGNAKEVQIKKKKYYDILQGGFSYFTVQLLQKKKFETLLEKWEKEYDLLFFISDVEADDPFIAYLKEICGRVVVGVAEERVDQILENFRPGEESVAFITAR